MRRGYPKAIEHGVQLKRIQPDKPTQNAYIESFNGKFRDEYLSELGFQSLARARAVIQAWRQDDNELWPHSNLDDQTPAERAEQLRQRP